MRVLLATLACSPNQVVPASTLVDAMWQEEPSRQRERNLSVQIYQLRLRLRELGPYPEAPRIVTQPPGYRLVLGDEQLDVAMFDSVTARGRQSLTAGDHMQAASLLREALGLWRGPALADVAEYSPWLAAVASSLDERRLAVLEDRLEADLAAGQHSEVVPELTTLVAAHPLRERLWGQLMLALYRGHRQADALDIYRKARTLLRDELGLEPGPALRSLHQAILQGDPALDPPARLGPNLRAPAQAAVPRQLPASVRHFAGREIELKELDGMLGSAAGQGGTVVITAIGGIGGVGKTALALHWAHQVADRFPDGQLHVNLRGFDPAGPPVSAAEAIRGFLEALGVPPDEMPATTEAQAGLYRSLLAGRRMLIVLDNARDSAQARSLLPASLGSLVIVTSRTALSGLAVVDGAAVIALGPVSAEEAVRILATRLGPDRLAAEPQALSDVISYCSRLPLALAIAAARAAFVPDRPLAALAAEMASEADLLDALDGGEEATSMRAVFSWSYRQLTRPAAALFRQLGLHPGPDITIPAAASLAAVSSAEARRLLTELAASSLLTEQIPGRYALHDLVRVYAAEQAAVEDTEAERSAAIGRALAHSLYSGWAACLAIEPASALPLPPLPTGTQPETCSSRSAGVRWLRAEHHILVRAVVLAGAVGFDEYAWQINWTLALDSYLRFWDEDADLAAVNEIAVAAARRLGDPTALGTAYLATAFDDRRAGLLDESIVLYKQALACYEQTGDLSRLADTALGLSDALIDQSRPAEALQYAQQAAANYGNVGRHHGQSLALALASWTYVALGDPLRARDVSRHAIGLCAGRADRAFYAVVSWISAGYASLQLGDLPDAISSYEHAISICERHEFFAADHADALFGLGDAYEAAGEIVLARRAWQEGLRVLGAKTLRPLARHRWGRKPADPIRAKIENSVG